MAHHPDAIVVDAGSTDAGPHKLGAGVSIVSKQACKKDLELIITAGAAARIPVIIGSAGGSGAAPHVEWTRSIVMEFCGNTASGDSKWPRFGRMCPMIWLKNVG